MIRNQTLRTKLNKQSKNDIRKSFFPLIGKMHKLPEVLDLLAFIQLQIYFRRNTGYLLISHKGFLFLLKKNRETA